VVSNSAPGKKCLPNVILYLGVYKKTPNFFYLKKNFPQNEYYPIKIFGVSYKNNKI
jgi:hypothetical protein